jgi:outer membrane immunogenic protein
MRRPQFHWVLALAGAINWVALGVSYAEGSNVWDGVYAGLNAGGASNSACSEWALEGTGGPAAGGSFGNQACASGDSFVGGVQIGDNFQYGHLVWGLEAMLDYRSQKSATGSLPYTGTTPASGIYEFSSKFGPTELAIIAPRLGYAGSQWLPYIKAGGIITTGARDSMVAYTAGGATAPTVSFNGTKNFGSFGWVAGGGIEWGLYGPWSMGFEYLHTSLGKASGSAAACAGSAAACEAFAGIRLQNTNNGFTSNVFRIGVSYYFGWW